MIKCDACRKPATVNYQRDWVKYPIDKKDNYGTPAIDNDIEEPVGENNLHLCDDCAEKWHNGEIDNPRE